MATSAGSSLPRRSWLLCDRPLAPLRDQFRDLAIHLRHGIAEPFAAAPRCSVLEGNGPVDRGWLEQEPRTLGLVVKQTCRPRQAEIPRIAEQRNQEQDWHERTDFPSTEDTALFIGDWLRRETRDGCRAEPAENSERRDRRRVPRFGETRFHERVPPIKVET